jgi:prepilin-type N-terminal cleavage/methylation domain-containing protein
MSNNNAGFTLVEIILVMAISGLLLVIALVGQHQLQARSRFDAAIDKTLQNLAYARNEASAGVNTFGTGNNSSTVLGGVAIEFNNRHYDEGFPMEEITNLYADQDESGHLLVNTIGELPAGGIAVCPANEHPDDNDECVEEFLQLGDNLTVSGDGINVWGMIEFVNNTGHSLIICNHPDSGGGNDADACANPITTPIDLTFTDPDGFSAQIEIDPNTGYAKRL